MKSKEGCRVDLSKYEKIKIKQKKKLNEQNKNEWIKIALTKRYLKKKIKCLKLFWTN